MEGRGRSRRRSLHREWKKRLSSVLAVVLTAVMILNMPLSIDGLRMHISDAFASGDNAGRNSVWATASNASKEHGDSQDVDIYVIADEEAVPGNRSSMTLYLKNNTDQAISEGVLEFSGKYIEKEDASFTDIGSGEEVSQVIIAGPGQETEASGEGMLYQESGNETGSVIGQDIASAENDDALTQTDADDEMDGIEDEADAAEDAGETDEEEPWKLTSIDLQPGELHEVYFEFYTDDDVESTKANVTFKFHGENEDGKRIAGESKFYYSIGLPHVNISLEDGMQNESGVPNDMEIWMSEPDWVDEDLEDRIEEQEEEEAEKEMEEDAESEDTASDSQADKASDSDASRADNASDSNADKNTGNEDGISQEDAEKIHKYTEEAMEISESKVSYTVTVFGMQLSDFQARKTQEAEDIGWISCIYEAARDTQPGIYYGKVTAVGKWNKRAFTSEQGFLFEVTGEGKTGQEFTEELSNMTVHAYAEEGILPDGVQMKVTELSQDKADTAEQYKKAVQALNDHEVSYDGMLAVDISFINEEGEEIEPDGEVQVSIQMKKDALPEDVDLGTVEVHHLKELDAETVIPEAVADGADKTDGTVQSAEDAVVALEEEGVPEEEIKAAVDEDAAAVAMFSVDGFSTFVITFRQDNELVNQVNFVILDADLNELNVPTGEGNYKLDYEINTVGEREYFADIIKQQGLDTITIEGTEYVYKSAYINIDGLWQFIDSIECIEETVGIWPLQRTEYHVRFHRPDEGGDAFYTRDDGSACDVGLLYQKQEDIGSGDIQTETELQRTKTVTLNADGTYDLELTLSGEVGSINKKALVDIVFVVDQSASMETGNRNITVGEQVAALTESLSSNDKLDVRYSVVSFSSGIVNQQYYKDAAMQQYWTRNLAAIQDAATIENPEGGTNYEAGLRITKTLLEDARDSALKYVIFLSDGEPTYHYDSNGNTDGGANHTTATDISNAEAAAKKLTNLNGFFSIRVGNEANADQYLSRVCNAAYEGSEGYRENFKNYQAEYSENLQKVFEMIEGQITQLLCENVTLTDELSEYVVPVGDAQPVLTVLNEKGEDVTVTGITASFTNGKIQVDFPDYYKLQPGYIYKVNLNIEPSEAAYAYYSANNGYPTGVLGEENTGTHSMDKGFYSNKEAKVEYEFNGLKQTNMYPKPVVQLQTVNVTIKKEVAGNMADINESFLFSYQVNDGASEPISLSHKGEFTISAKKGSKILISEAPETGYETQITVVSGDANISNISGSYRTDKITQDTVIVFTNTKQVDVPTGIFSNQIPYLLMISIAAIGTTGFIYPVYRHKRHRRDK